MEQIPALASALSRAPAGSTPTPATGPQQPLGEPSLGWSSRDPVPCQPGTSCVLHYTSGLHLAGAVMDMNIADLHIGMSHRAPGRSPLCLCWDWVSCLASANWDPPGMPRFKAPVSRQKKQKAWFKDMPLWKHRCFTLTPFWCFSGSHRISSSQGRQRPCSGLW